MQKENLFFFSFLSESTFDSSFLFPRLGIFFSQPGKNFFSLYNVLWMSIDKGTNVVNGYLNQTGASLCGSPCNVWGDVGI